MTTRIKVTNEGPGDIVIVPLDKDGKEFSIQHDRTLQPGETEDWIFAYAGRGYKITEKT